jgi:hypothetical protein
VTAPGARIAWRKRTVSFPPAVRATSSVVGLLKVPHPSYSSILFFFIR